MKNKSLCKHISAFLPILFMVLVANVPHALGYSNPIEGGSTVSVTNAWTVPGGDLYVGQTTPENSLVMSNGVIYDTHGFIGSHEGSSSNKVILVGPVSKIEDLSEWYNSESLYLGGHKEGTNWVDGGAGNTLTVNAHSWVFVGKVDEDTRYLLSGSIAVGDASGSPEMIIANGSMAKSPGFNYIGFGANESGSVEVRGGGSVWDTRSVFATFSKMFVGWSGSDNRLSITDGGQVLFDDAYLGHEAVSINNVLLVTGERSRLDGMSVYVGDYGSGNRLAVTDGGTAECFSVLIGANKGADGNSVQVTGTAATLRTGSLWVGYQGAGNILTVSDGGELYSSRAFVGSSSGSNSNVVFVSGLDSVWNNINALRLGDGGRGNALYVSDGGLVSVGEEMYSRNYSTVSVSGPGSRIEVGGNYYQDATSIFRFGVGTNGAESARLSVAGTAEFEAGATLQYRGDPAGLAFDRVSTNWIIAADQLVVGGVTNAHDLGGLAVEEVGSSLVDLILWESDQDIYGLASRRHLAQSAGFAPGSQLASLSDEIDTLSVQGNPNAVSAINLLNDLSGVQQNRQLSQQYSRGTADYLHVRGMTEGMKQIRKHTAHVSPAQAEAPEGPAGPHRQAPTLQTWVKPYGAWAEHDAADGFAGYDHNIYGTIVGLDKPFGRMLAGIAGGYGRSHIRQTDGDSSEGRTGYGVLYFNWGTEEWFSDLSLAYGRTRVDQRSGTLFGNSADFDADNAALYLGGGKEIQVNRSWLVTPEAAALWSWYSQEAYTERSTLGVPRVVDRFSRNSLLTRLGGAIAWEKELKSAVLQPEARCFWLHEFNDGSETLGYQLANGLGGRYRFALPAPESDALETGLGLSCLFNEKLELVFDVDWRFSEEASAYALSGRAVIEF